MNHHIGDGGFSQPSSITVETFDIIQEDGFAIILEDGSGFIILE